MVRQEKKNRDESRDENINSIQRCNEIAVDVPRITEPGGERRGEA